MPAKKSKTREIKKLDGEATLEEALNLPFDEMDLVPIGSIDALLANRDAIIRLADIVSSGGSIRSVELSLGLPDNLLKEWLNIGKTEREGPFRILYQYYMRASAEARIGAEASLLAKSPEKWLDRVDASLELEKSDPTLSLPGKASAKTASKDEVEIEDGHIEVPEPE